MAKNKQNPDHIPQGVLIGAGVLVGVGALALLIRSLKKKIELSRFPELPGLDSIIGSFSAEVQSIADRLSGTDRIIALDAATERAIAASQAIKDASQDPLVQSMALLAQLEAAGEQAIQLGQRVAVVPAIDNVTARIARLQTLTLAQRLAEAAAA